MVQARFVAVFFLAFALTGCGEQNAKPDARPRADAHIPNYACADQPPPDVLPDRITVSGWVFRPGIPGVREDEPIVGTLVQAFELGTNRVLSTTVTDEAGNYELVTEGETEIIETYLKVTNPLYLETRILPPRPPTSDIPFDIPLFHIEDRDLVQMRAEVEQENSLGFAIVGVVDYDYFPVEGATVSISPEPGSIIYQDDLGFPHPNITHTSYEGFAFLFNVPEGEITVNAELNGMAFRPVVATVQRWTQGIVWGVGIGP